MLITVEQLLPHYHSLSLKIEIEIIPGFQVRCHQPTAGLEIMENMSLHMEAAYEHLFRYGGSGSEIEYSFRRYWKIPNGSHSDESWIDTLLQVDPIGMPINDR